MTNKVKAVLIVSLLFNVLLIGWIAGAALHHFRGERGFHRDDRAALERLSDEKRTLFLETLKQTRAASSAYRKEMSGIRKKTLAILTAPEFDEQAYRSAVGELHRLRTERMDRLSDTTGRLARQLNQDERRILAELLERHPRHPRREGPP